MYACLYRPPAPETSHAEHAASAETPGSAGAARPACDVAAIARDYSPRYERHSAALVSLDVSGLERLFGSPRGMAEEMRRDAAARGVRVHVAIAGTRTAAVLLAHARAGVSVVLAGDEVETLAPLPLRSLSILDFQLAALNLESCELELESWRRWGLRTLGDLAKLPPADLSSRLGRAALVWQAMARGEDVRPLIPTLEDERFEGTFELDWPVEDLEPLSFVLTRLLEPLSTRLERRDRGAAVLHVLLRLVTRELHARRLELPSPMRDVRTLRTLALLDLESHPPPAAVDRVTVVIDPTPGRVLQHSLFSRALPTPEQLSTLLARLGAVMGQDRAGAPAAVDTHRPGAFAMKPFKTDREGPRGSGLGAGSRAADRSASGPRRPAAAEIASALRRCRQPVPARVVVEAGCPVRLTTDRRGFAGGAIVRCAGPWRASGDWWGDGRYARDEWDVALDDGAVYRIFQDRQTDAWFVDAIVD